MVRLQSSFNLEACGLNDNWLSYVQSEFSLPYMCQLQQFLTNEVNLGKTIYPATQDIFNAFNRTPLANVKVVILGQDPYHGENQAHGLCFSVPLDVRMPPSLKNIAKEIERDFGFASSKQGCLQSWADQGVLLLNAILTVERARAGSHQGRGWEQFTDRVIQIINEQCSGVVFLLWGSYAQKKGQLIKTNKHLVLTAPHPSPLSAYRGFIGCGHFSQANQYLKQQGQAPIDWRLPC